METAGAKGMHQVTERVALDVARVLVRRLGCDELALLRAPILLSVLICRGSRQLCECNMEGWGEEKERRLLVGVNRSRTLVRGRRVHTADRAVVRDWLLAGVQEDRHRCQQLALCSVRCHDARTRWRAVQQGLRWDGWRTQV